MRHGSYRLWRNQSQNFTEEYRAMIERILFPVDFSPVSAAMATYVKRAAAIFGSQVTLVHVCDLASHNGFELYLRSLQEIAEEHWGVARSKLDSFLESEFPLADCPGVLRLGEASAEIVEFARTGGFDLIIMPTHAGRFRQMLLGSTTAKVLNDADCPAMTTEHAETTAPRPLEHREWVCASGLGPDSERVLTFASRAAAQAGAKLSVIRAIQNGDPSPVKEVLLKEVRRSAADALIIGRTPGSDALGRMRDLTYSVVRDSPVPVLSI
jgi:nucleotide-binding universal stress UspA family protein